ncbi:MAG: S8 family serine peptidase [Syntrophotaleaceae bacterium]
MGLGKRVPDWYGRLDLTDALPISKPTQASDLWMILYEDWFDQQKIAGDRTLIREVMAFRNHVEQSFPDAVVFDFLPILFVRGSRNKIESLSRVPRYRYAFPQTVEVDDYLPVLRGINALRSETGHQLFEWQAFVQKGGILPDDSFVGGMMPEGRYPSPLDSRLILSDPMIPRSTPPAWMPVLNLSIGPMLPENPLNPVLIALSAAANTHLVVVAAGNAGMLEGLSTLNGWAPLGSAMVVGATEDDQGLQLAKYSSTGLPADDRNHPDVVAWGDSPLGTGRGTSFAAPRVAKLGCLAAAAVFQVLRVQEECLGRSVGVPLVGWGMIDTGGEIAVLPAHDGSTVLPFGGIDEQVLGDTFQTARRTGKVFNFFLNGALLRSMIIKSAKRMPGYGVQQVGAGFVNEKLFLDWLARQTVEDFLAPFGPIDLIPSALRQRPVFHRDGLAGFADAAKRAQPIWFFDYERQRFGVNRSPDKGEQRLPLSGRGVSHGIQVALS